MPLQKNTRSYLENLTLLCVEDSAVIQLIYKKLFSSLFKEVVFAGDGLEGFKLSENVDIIITDYQMPVMNGLTMMSHIRKVDADIPIILVTSFEDIEILKDAILLKVNSFVHKPFQTEEIWSSISRAVEQLVGHKFLLEQQKSQIDLLEKKEEYSNYQEELSFKKELSMVRNDFYYRLSEQDTSEGFYLADFYYNPFDTTSGDLYSARRLSHAKEIYFLVDGMGKGLSASVSAILFTSHVNYMIDKVLKQKRFCDFEHLINNTIEYMREHLLDEEVLAASLVCIDTDKKTIKYAAFGMPAILFLDENAEVQSICSNNPPISQYTKKGNVNLLDMKSMVKILISSDGIHENSVKGEDKTYAEYIKEDFKNAMTREDFRCRLESRIAPQEDDMTFIFLHKINWSNERASISIPARIKNIEEVGAWYEAEVNKLTDDASAVIKASLGFTELLMNAYEHGSLGITHAQKHKLVEDDNYFDYIKEHEVKVDKKINISINKIENSKEETYIFTKIEDNGKGFDTQVFSEIFGIHKNFNGRGALIARKSSLGIYYNNQGNCVYFVNKL